jgi:hypothetical protein
MSTNENHKSVQDEKTPSVSPGNYSPVTVNMKDTLGAIFLGILTVILLIGWRRTEAKYRILLAQQESMNGNHIPYAE